MGVAAGDRSDFSVSGRGLQLVDELASRWGIERDTDHKTVWFELDADQPHP
jgi:hypothetical protein